jgi:hypothetical protein
MLCQRDGSCKPIVSRVFGRTMQIANVTFSKRGDIEEGLNATAQIGDDRIQRRAGGYVVPEGLTHGSAEQHVGCSVAESKAANSSNATPSRQARYREVMVALPDATHRNSIIYFNKQDCSLCHYLPNIGQIITELGELDVSLRLSSVLTEPLDLHEC